MIHVIDASGSEGRNPLDDFDNINKEMRSYSPKLAEKPQLVALNKIDVANPADVRIFEDAIRKKGYKTYQICAPTGEGVTALMEAAYSLLSTIPCEAEDTNQLEYDATRPEQHEDYREIYIRKEGDVFVLNGKQLEKIVRSTNFNDAGSLRYLQRYIEDRGVIERLSDMGLKDGDTIRAIDYDFEYRDDD